MAEHKKIEVYSFPVRVSWEGDYQRRPGDTGIREGVTRYWFVKKEDAPLVSAAVSFEKLIERVTGVSYPVYAAQVLSACEDGDPDAIARDNEVRQKAQGLIDAVIEYRRITVDCEPLNGTPEGYVPFNDASFRYKYISTQAQEKKGE